MIKLKPAIVFLNEVSLSKKEERCLAYLRMHGSITSDQARQELGDARLSETIFQLRNKGYAINCLRIDTTNRYGEPTWYGKYVLAR